MDQDLLATGPVQHFLLGQGLRPDVDVCKLTTMSRAVIFWIWTTANINMLEEIFADTFQVDVLVLKVDNGLHAILKSKQIDLKICFGSAMAVTLTNRM